MSKQRGRPIGATSTIRVKMKDLVKHIHPNGTVVVGRTWLDEVGFNIDESQIVTISVVRETPENTIIETKPLI